MWSKTLSKRSQNLFSGVPFKMSIVPTIGDLAVSHVTGWPFGEDTLQKKTPKSSSNDFHWGTRDQSFARRLFLFNRIYDTKLEQYDTYWSIRSSKKSSVLDGKLRVPCHLKGSNQQITFDNLRISTLGWTLQLPYIIKFPITPNCFQLVGSRSHCVALPYPRWLYLKVPLWNGSSFNVWGGGGGAKVQICPIPMTNDHGNPKCSWEHKKHKAFAVCGVGPWFCSDGLQQIDIKFGQRTHNIWSQTQDVGLMSSTSSGKEQMFIDVGDVGEAGFNLPKCLWVWPWAIDHSGWNFSLNQFTHGAKPQRGKLCYWELEKMMVSSGQNLSRK